MIILGIDPGTAVTGFGVIYCRGEKVKLIDHGCIKTSNNFDHPERLDLIYRQISQILRKHKPQVLAIESLFFNVNAKSASAVGQAMGVIKLAAARKKTKVFEYPPLKIKMSLTGKGRAKKNKVQLKVKQALGLKTIPRPTHVADALAVALCHWQEKKDKK